MSRGPDGIRGLPLDGKSIVRSGSSVEENRACKRCRIFGLRYAFISSFCFMVNWGASRGMLKLDINHEESYLLTEMVRKKSCFKTYIISFYYSNHLDHNFKITFYEKLLA